MQLIIQILIQQSIIIILILIMIGAPRRPLRAAVRGLQADASPAEQAAHPSDEAKCRQPKTVRHCFLFS